MFDIQGFNENSVEIKQLEEKERCLYIALQVWRDSIGKSEYINLNGFWRSNRLGYGSTLPMADHEIVFAGIISETLDYIADEKKKVLEAFLERLYNARR